jgi:D-alanyl-D-alanine endopeptidase (penicillin-binding protein 7)
MVACSGVALPAAAEPAQPAKKRVAVTYKTTPKTGSTTRRAPARKPAPAIRDVSDGGELLVQSSAALVIDQQEGSTLYGKNVASVTPIASITKVMTAMVVLDARLPLDETVAIDPADVDTLKRTHSRLAVGTPLTRGELLRLALMSSENRAAAALGRAYPGGTPAFLAAMNQKAAELGMLRTRFADSTGLSSSNVSTAEDLAKMVRAAYDYPLIRDYSTTPEYQVATIRGRPLQYRNSNGLVKDPDWTIGLQKTGYISEAGRCLVMQTMIAARPVIIVLLDSWGKYTRIGDANRIKRWMETTILARKPDLG